MPEKATHWLQVRLTEAEKRHIRTMVISQGLTLRKAILLAFAAWAERLEARAAAPAQSVPATKEQGMAQPPRRSSAPRERGRSGEAKSAAASGGGQAPVKASLAWLRGAAKLDWSKCPAVEALQGKSGRIWVVRGTDAPLVAVLDAIAGGNPLLEIAEVFGITLAELIAVLQFAAEAAPISGS